MPGDRKPGCKSDRLRQHGRERSARNTEIEPEHEQHGERDVDRVDHDLQRQRRGRARDAGEPADQRQIAEREGRRPDAYEEIGLCRLPHRIAAAEEIRREQGERHLQHHQHGADDGGKQKRAREHGALVRRVAGAERLRGECDRTHAQETEQPVDGVSISPDGKYIASGSLDKTIRIWRADDPGTQLKGSPIPVVRPLLTLFVGQDGNWVIWNEELGLASTRRPHQAHDQPDRHDQHGAKQEIAPQSLEGLVAHVPDRLEQLADAADDVERIEAQHPKNEPYQHRQQGEPEEDDKRAPTEKAVQRAWLRGGFGYPWFLGQAHGFKVSTIHDSAATRGDNNIASSVSSRSASPGGLSQRRRLMRGKRIAIPDL